MENYDSTEADALFDALGFDTVPSNVPALQDVPSTELDDDDLDFSYKNSVSAYGVEALKKKPSSKLSKGISSSAEQKIAGGISAETPAKKTLHAKIQQDVSGKSYRESQEVLLRYVKYFWGEPTIKWPAMQRVISACGKDFAEVIKLVVQVSLTPTDNPQGLMMAWNQKRQQAKGMAKETVWDSQPLRDE